MTVTGAFFSSKVICYRSPWTNRTSLLMGSNFLLSVILQEVIRKGANISDVYRAFDSCPHLQPQPSECSTFTRDSCEAGRVAVRKQSVPPGQARVGEQEGHWTDPGCPCPCHRGLSRPHPTPRWRLPAPPGVPLRPQGVPMCSPRKELYVCSVTGGQRGVGTAPPTLGSL